MPSGNSITSFCNESWPVGTRSPDHDLRKGQWESRKKFERPAHRLLSVLRSGGRTDLPSAENQHSTSRLLLQARRLVLRWFSFSRLGIAAVHAGFFFSLKPVSLAACATSARVIPWLSLGCAWATHRYWLLAAWSALVPRKWPLRSPPLTTRRPGLRFWAHEADHQQR